MFAADLIIIITIIIFVIYGFKVGFLRAIISLIGLVIGSLLASRFYGLIATWLITKTGWNDNFCYIFIFIVILILVSRFINLIFWIIRKIFHIVSWIPFTTTINRLLGIFFGLVEGIVILSLAIFFIEQLNMAEKLRMYLESSLLAPYLVKIASFILPFI